MAGNGTIGLELVEDLPDVDTVLVPFGGGGLSTGIASAVKALRPRREGLRRRSGDRPGGRAPRSRPASRRTVEHTPSFVDGSGGVGVLDAMWPYVSEALDGALRRLARRDRRRAFGCSPSACA